MIRMEMPEDVRFILNTLRDHGYEAYAVGGCVRDTLLSRTPKDWDVTTIASPEEVKACFFKTIDTGIEHGTVTVMLHRTGYEVTTYRIDGKYSDSRHPESVTFTKSLSEDLKRRDFTINAMAYNDEDGVIDLFSGSEDLKNKVIRAVGVAEERFTEDALRILRCLRFASQLGFSIEEETYAAAKKLAPTLHNISRERIREELLKIILSPHPEFLQKMEEIGAFGSFYPEFTEKEGEIIAKIRSMPDEKILKLAAFFEGVEDSANVADRVFDELRFDNSTRDRVCHILKFADRKIEENEVAVRFFVNEFEEADFREFLIFTGQEEKIGPIYEKIQSRGDCVSLKTLAITGKDLIRLGMKPGKGIGTALKDLLEVVLKTPSENQQEELFSLAKEIIAKQGESC